MKSMALFLSHQTFDNKLDDEKIKATSIWSLGFLLTGAMKSLRGPQVDETASRSCTWTEIRPSPHGSRSKPVPRAPSVSLSQSHSFWRDSLTWGCHHSHRPSHSKPGHVPISCCPGGWHIQTTQWHENTNHSDHIWFATLTSEQRCQGWGHTGRR